MRTTDTNIARIRNAVGTAMWISWIMFLGPMGLFLLLGVSYAIAVQNLALGIVCGLLLGLPVVLTIVWAPLGWFALLSDRLLALEAEMARVRVIDE